MALRPVAPEPVWEPTAILAELEGDREFVVKLIECFLNQYPKILSDIRESLRRGDSTLLERSAHKLKGSVSHFGAPSAYEAARRLEEIGRNGDLDGAEEAEEDLEREIGRLEEHLAEFSRSGMA